MVDVTKQLISGSQELGLALTEDQVKKFSRYLQLLMKWNNTYNLTAITDAEGIVVRHFLDSLSIIPYLKGRSILDVGSGAGFPGLPCAILLPEKDLVLLDSNGKKTRFLMQVVGELHLGNVIVVQSRVEKYQPSKCFDTITARAFSSVKTIIAQTSHLLCPQGQLVLMKGVYPGVELAEAAVNTEIFRLKVPGLDEERHVICIKGLSHD